MLDMLLFAGSVWLTSIPPPSEPAFCDYLYKAPAEIEERIEQEGGMKVTEIRERSPTGFISLLFINLPNNRVFLLEGWFVESGDGIAPCGITSAKEIDENDGHILFEWPKK